MKVFYVCLVLELFALANAQSPESATINSTGFYDTAGAMVHAHGGGFYVEDGVYYWIGTTRKVLPGDLSAGINLYSSRDLQHWTFLGEIFKNTSITVPLPHQQLYRIERPKLLFNQMTKKYVIWFHLDSSSFSLRMVGVATASNITGPYEFVSGFKPDGLNSYDMSVYQDPDGHAYLVRSVQNQYAGISRLTDDYLNTTGITSKGPRIEGQAIFKRGGKYYLIGSHLTGWKANPAVLCVSKNPTLDGAEWEELGNPTDSDTTFNSQSTFVLSYTHPSGKQLNIFMADRWKAPDVADADYLWLPFQSDDSDHLSIKFMQTWKIKDF